MKSTLKILKNNIFTIVVIVVFIIGMFGYIVFLGKKRPHAAQLQDALAAVQHGQLIHAHQFAAKALIIGGERFLPPVAFACIGDVDGFLSQCFRQVFQGCFFFAA